MAYCQSDLCISLIQRPHYITSSYTYQFFEKSYFIIVLQKISCTRQFESQLSLRSFALSFRVKDCLSTLLQLIGFLYIVTWKHRLIVLIPIFHAGKVAVFNRSNSCFFCNNSSLIRSHSSRSFFVSDLIFKVSCIIALLSSFKETTANFKAAAFSSNSFVRAW